MSARSLVGGSLIALLLIASGSARADDAREQKAKKACAAGRVDEGVELLADLFTETGDLNYVYNQGRCYQQNGVPDKAINRFREYLRRAPDIASDDRREVEQFIKELEQQMKSSGKTPPDAAAPAESVVQAAPTQEPGSDAAQLRKIGIVIGAVGVAAIGVAVFLSLKVRASEREVERDVAATDFVDPQSLSGKMRDGARLETFQWVAYGIGAAALAGGATCYLLGLRADRERRVAWTVVPSGDGRGVFTGLRARY